MRGVKLALSISDAEEFLVLSSGVIEKPMMLLGPASAICIQDALPRSIIEMGQWPVVYRRCLVVSMWPVGHLWS